MTKHPFDSKTLWFNLILAASAFWIPQVKEFFDENPEVTPLVFMAMNVVLRFLTKEAVSFRMPLHFFGLVNSKAACRARARELAEGMELPQK